MVRATAIAPEQIATFRVVLVREAQLPMWNTWTPAEVF